MDRRRFRAALRLLEGPARTGDVSSQLMLGSCWDQLGERAQALSWYRRAARAGEASAANNIAILHREDGNRRLARAWFWRAVRLGGPEALYELAVLSRGKQRVVLLRRMLRHRVLIPAVREDGAALLAATLRESS